MTWSENEWYKYINNLWDKVEDITSFDEKIFSRDLLYSINLINDSNINISKLNITVKDISLTIPR